MKKFIVCWAFFSFFAPVATYAAVDAEVVLDMANLEEQEVNNLLTEYKENEEKLLGILRQQIGDRASEFLTRNNEPREIFAFILAVYSTFMRGAEAYIADATQEVSRNAARQAVVRPTWDKVKYAESWVASGTAAIGFANAKVDGLFSLTERLACRSAKKLVDGSKDWYAEMETAWKLGGEDNFDKKSYCSYAEKFDNFDGINHICEHLTIANEIQSILNMSQLRSLKLAMKNKDMAAIDKILSQMMHEENWRLIARNMGGSLKNTALETIKKASSSAASTAIAKLELSTSNEISSASYKLVNLHVLASFIQSDFMNQTFRDIYGNVNYLLTSKNNFKLSPKQIHTILTHKDRVDLDMTLKQKLIKSFKFNADNKDNNIIIKKKFFDPIEHDISGNNSDEGENTENTAGQASLTGSELLDE